MYDAINGGPADGTARLLGTVKAEGQTKIGQLYDLPSEVMTSITQQACSWISLS